MRKVTLVTLLEEFKKQNVKFDHVFDELKKINLKVDSLDAKTSSHYVELTRLNVKVSSLNVTVNSHHTELKKLNTKMDSLDAKVDSHFEFVKEQIKLNYAEMKSEFIAVRTDLKIICDQTALVTE